MNDEILEESLNLLKHHYHPEWRDRSAMCVFNRLLAKQIIGPGGDRTAHTPYLVSQIRSHREQRTTEELSKFRKWHNNDSPHDTECPIILAVHDGVELLLDGHTRINYWLKIGDSGLHIVNVHIVGA